jgi:hypothetical protein
MLLMVHVATQHLSSPYLGSRIGLLVVCHRHASDLALPLQYLKNRSCGRMMADCP